MAGLVSVPSVPSVPSVFSVDPEKGEDGKSSADVGRVQEGAAKMFFRGERDQGTAGVGDGDEILSGPVAFELPEPVVEIAEETECLGGCAGFGGDQEKGFLQGSAARGAGNGRR